MEQELNAVTKLKDTETYALWKFQVDILIKSAGLYGYVDGTINYPTDKTLVEAWVKADAKVQKFIICTIDKNVLIHIMNCKTSNEMYTCLKTLYDRDSEQQKLCLLTDFYNFKLNSKVSIADNVARLQNIVYRLKSLQENISDTQFMAKVLNELPENLKHFGTAWESTAAKDKTITNLIARLTAEEIKYSEGSGSKEDTSVAFKANTYVNKYQNIKCNFCKKPGHLARDCRQKQKMDRSGASTSAWTHPPRQKFCNVCKKRGHEEKDCWFNKDKEKVAFLTSSGANKQKFVIDSGSSWHLVNNTESLTNTVVKKIPFTVANNGEMRSEAVGTVSGQSCILQDVAYVPDLHTNLLSVNKVTENDGTVVFNKNEVLILKNGQEILKGKKNKIGLYEVELNTTTEPEPVLAVSTQEEWHRKMGHICTQSLQKLKKMADGVEFKDGAENFCEVCVKAKHKRHPFKGHLPIASRVLEIIHTDVFGPTDTPTHDGKRYFISFVDDYTQYTEAYLMKSKDEAAEILKNYVNRVENEKQAKIGTIKCDGGTEYKPALHWLKQKGITVDVNCPYSSQLNGKAERMHLTLLQKVRALLFDAKMEKEFWGEALNTACYLTNRSPTSTKEVTPIELWTNKRPNLSKIEMFGCDAYVKKLSYTKKLDEKSIKMKLVGYANVGYRLWDSEKKKIVISRDVIFDRGQKKIEDENLDQFRKDSKREREKIVSLDLGGEDDIEDSSDENEESEGNFNDETNVGEEETDGEGSEDSYQDTVSHYNLRSVVNRPAYLDDFELDVSGVTMLTYTEALKSPEKEYWEKAIQEEKESLEKNNTWKYVKAKEADGRKLLTSKWVLTKKDNGMYKARLVVRGFEQVPGIDYEETYSPVVDMTSIRILLTIAAVKQFKFKIFDVKTAYLNSPLQADIYMHIPLGYIQKKGMICKLNKSLYGLKQSAKEWNETLGRHLEKIGLKALKADPCVYKNNTNTVYLAIYVDDGIIVGNEPDILNMLDKIKRLFEIKISKNTDSFIGMKIFENKNGIYMNQEVYTRNVIEKYNMGESKPADTPIVLNNEIDESLDGVFPYREAIGSLLYLSTKTRPDLSFAVGFESRNMERPTTTDVKNIKRTLRYLRKTESFGIVFPKKGDIKDLKLNIYTDSDYAGDIKTRRSTTGVVCLLGGVPIAWCSKRQPIVTLSSTEAEFVAATEGAKYAIYLKSFIQELIEKEIKPKIIIDNTSAISLIKNGNLSPRCKHMDVKYLFISENYKRKLFDIEYLPTDKQIADIFTKALSTCKFESFRNLLVSKMTLNP